MGYFKERAMGTRPRRQRVADRVNPWVEATQTVNLLERQLLALHGSERIEMRLMIETMLEHAPVETACIEDGCTAPIATRGGHCQQHTGASPFALNPFAE